MRFRPNKILLSLICGACAFLAAGPLLHAQVISIQEFNAQQNHWKDQAVNGLTWTVEGRYNVIGTESMLFMNCTLPFRFVPGAERKIGSSTVVEVTGKLALDKETLYFAVEKIAARPSDAEWLEARRAALDPKRPGDWYRLADWGERRGEFYKDEALLKLARELNNGGFAAESQMMDPGERQRLADLVQKGRTKGVEEGLIRELLHRGLQVEFARLQDKNGRREEWDRLQQEISRDLPGATTALPSYPEKLADQYHERPVAMFAAADEPQRRILARVFHVDIATRQIQALALPDGSNGFEVVTLLLKQAPERQDLIQKYENLGLEWQTKKVDVMTRAQMLELAQKFDARNEPQRGREIREKWLTAREPALRATGARGLCDLAELWIELLGDRKNALRLYLDAWKVQPDYAPASDWLKREGYVLLNNAWVRSDEVPVAPKTAREVAIEQGRVVIGMSDRDVRAAIGVNPVSVTRIATGDGVDEIWMFESIVVRLSRSGASREAHVTAIESQNAARP